MDLEWLEELCDWSPLPIDENGKEENESHFTSEEDEEDIDDVAIIHDDDVKEDDWNGAEQVGDSYFERKGP